MYDICHPTYYHMSQLGCSDQMKLTTAFYVYMELSEVKKYWDVQYKFNVELQLFTLTAKVRKHSKDSTFVPWPAANNITLDFIRKIQDQLQRETITFIFREGDSSSVYYSMSTGILKPIDPEKSQEIRQKRAKRRELQTVIKRNTFNLYERALSMGSSCLDEKALDKKMEHTNPDLVREENMKLSKDSQPDTNNLGCNLDSTNAKDLEKTVEGGLNTNLMGIQDLKMKSIGNLEESLEKHSKTPELDYKERPRAQDINDDSQEKSRTENISGKSDDNSLNFEQDDNMEKNPSNSEVAQDDLTVTED